jgi:stearoyl-CoA desaturase (delta-9 desaturase)
MTFGVLALDGWDVLIVALALTHVSIVAVTVFLHRHQAHGTVDLHPVVSHFLRFWLWLTTGMVTREWVAIHRKHHARCETAEDPHSPQLRGIRKVLFEGSELYRQEAKNAATLETYGRGTPDDWLERKLYAKHSGLGIGIMLAIDLALFGPIGLTIWAVQMLWIPIFAAGVINGIGHYWGYRRYATRDASRNILPWGILIGGEELHNNHHAHVASARLSNRWWEFDIGWFYIRILELLRLAGVRRVAPRLRIVPGKTVCDAATLRAVCTHRYLVLGQFAALLKRTAAREIRQATRASAVPLRSATTARRAMKRWLQGVADTLSEAERDALEQMFSANAVLRKIAAMRQDLAALWHPSNATTAQLVSQLDEWCKRAESCGIQGLAELARRLRRYDFDRPLPDRS